MKFGIRKKLLLTYILAIIIPVAVTIILFLFVDVYLNNTSEFDSIDSSYNSVNSTIERITEHYDSIEDYDYFHQKVFEVLEGKENKIVITDLNGYRLFDSSNKTASISHDYYPVAEQDYYKIRYMDTDERIFRIVIPLINENEVIGKVELTQDRLQIDEVMLNKIVSALLLILGIVVFVVLFLIFLFTSIVSKSVIKPLHSLSESAQNIASGNLDYEIVYDKKNEFGDFVKTFNIMRLKLKHALEEQHNLENSRKELIASVSHDLRTPLTSIKGYVEAIKDGKAQNQEKLNQYLTVIYNKTNKLDRLIDDLFQFSQFELNNIKLNKQDYDSKVLLEKIYSEYRLSLENDGIQFIIKRPIASINLFIDIYMIERVFDNLLQNAKQFTQIANGKIQIGSHIKQNYLEVTISDNGQGIKEEDIPHIFNRFYRGEKSRSRDYGGAGLGLSICKEIIDRHNGKIWVESIYGQGTTFYLQLPI